MPIKLLRESQGHVFYINLVKELIRRYIRHDIGQTGGQLAYFSLLSLFPFIIYINTLINGLHIPADRLIAFLTPVFPAEIVNMISSYVEYISGYGSTKILSLGIVMTLYSASRSVRSMERAVNAAYGISKRRGFFGSVVLSMLFIVFFGIAIIIILLLSIVTRDLLERMCFFFGIAQQTVNFVLVLKWLFVAVAMFFCISALYYFMPNKKMRFRSVFPGTVLSIAGFSLLSFGFSIYVKYATRSSVLYGSIGAVVLLMLWMYIAGVILVLGAELNCVLE